MTRPKNERVPQDGHPFWEKASVPVLTFLRQGTKTWPELDAFAREARITSAKMVHILAWLENRYLARSRYARDGETILWRALQVPAKR